MCFHVLIHTVIVFKVCCVILWRHLDRTCVFRHTFTWVISPATHQTMFKSGRSDLKWFWKSSKKDKLDPTETPVIRGDLRGKEQVWRRTDIIRRWYGTIRACSIRLVELLCPWANLHPRKFICNNMTFMSTGTMYSKYIEFNQTLKSGS